jgi:hypothetical protein
MNAGPRLRLSLGGPATSHGVQDFVGDSLSLQRRNSVAGSSRYQGQIPSPILYSDRSSGVEMMRGGTAFARWVTASLQTIENRPGAFDCS